MITRARAITTLAAGAAAATLPLAARAANTPLSTGQVGKSIAFFPIFVAAQQGYFTDAGLDVTTTIFQTGQLVGAAMTSGSVDVGTSLMTDVFALLKANRPTQVIGSLVDGYYVDIIASNKLLADTKTSRASKLADKIRALKGKKIGITGPGSGTEALVVYLFKTAGLDTTRDAELVNVGADQASIIAALSSNRIDAVSFAWPLSMMRASQGRRKALHHARRRRRAEHDGPAPWLHVRAPRRDREEERCHHRFRESDRPCGDPDPCATRHRRRIASSKQYEL